jgi:hypothetical protein
MEVEIPKIVPTTKAGRKTNIARREKATSQDKDLGTQPTLKEILRKEEKNGKAHPVGQLRGGVNQLLLCLNNYAYFETHYITLNDDHYNAGK